VDDIEEADSGNESDEEEDYIELNRTMDADKLNKSLLHENWL
jgi:hypothetical protein